MYFFNILKHIWNKIYCDVDLPKNRQDICDLEGQKAFLEFFRPTTKGKYHNQENKPTRTRIADVVLFIPRLLINFIKIFTELLPLTLRELAYAGFVSLLDQTKSSSPLLSGLCRVGAFFCALFTGVFSAIYFLGCLITSPVDTLKSIVLTFNSLGYPRIGAAIGVFIGSILTLSIFIPSFLILVLLFPSFIPAPLFIALFLTPTLGLAGYWWNTLIEKFEGLDEKNPAENYTRVEFVETIPDNDVREDGVIYIKSTPESVENMSRLNYIARIRHPEKEYLAAVKNSDVKTLTSTQFFGDESPSDIKNGTSSKNDSFLMATLYMTRAAGLTPEDTTLPTWKNLSTGTFFKDIDHSTTVSICPDEFKQIFIP